MLLSLFPHLCFKVAPCSSCSESHILCFKVAPRSSCSDSHILCFKVAPCFSYSESHKLSFSYYWEFFIIELGLYILMMGFLKCLRSSWARKLDAHPLSFEFELSYTYSSIASVAWQSLLTCIDWWKYALEAIIKLLLLYVLIHDKCLLFMLELYWPELRYMCVYINKYHVRSEPLD